MELNIVETNYFNNLKIVLPDKLNVDDRMNQNSLKKYLFKSGRNNLLASLFQCNSVQPPPPYVESFVKLFLKPYLRYALT